MADQESPQLSEARCQQTWFSLQCEKPAGHGGMCESMCENGGVRFVVNPPELAVFDDDR